MCMWWCWRKGLRCCCLCCLCWHFDEIINQLSDGKRMCSARKCSRGEDGTESCQVFSNIKMKIKIVWHDHHVLDCCCHVHLDHCHDDHVCAHNNNNQDPLWWSYHHQYDHWSCIIIQQSGWSQSSWRRTAPNPPCSTLLKSALPSSHSLSTSWSVFSKHLKHYMVPFSFPMWESW